MKFKNIYTETEKRLEECLLSLWAKGQHPMRPSIERLFRREPFMAEPLFQSSFGWEQIPAGTNWKRLFNPQVAQMIEDFGTDHGQREWAPYKHQYECWEILHNGGAGNAQSVVVTSGTGSGKTECFLYPVLDDLFRHRGEGVQAIFMYPLNALAADQKGRIEKCCDRLGLTFANYNGNLPHKGTRVPGSSELPSREEVHRQRPDLMMTNPSMLEYIMVRDNDRPVMEPNSPAQQGSTLRWIVIDEAHTYTGSAAVELRYELARVIKAFGANINDVHFACTSATIGANERQLVGFISELTGQDPARIHVKGGNRIVPQWTQQEIQAELTAKTLPFTPDQVLQLRDELNNSPKGYLSCSDIHRILFPATHFNQSRIPIVLDALDELCDISRVTPAGKTVFLLMARAHFFMREPNGLFACVNPSCPEHGESPMGFLTSFDGKCCPHCGAPLLELVQCRNCGEFMYTAKEDTQTHEVTIHRDRSFDDIDNIFAEDDNATAIQGANARGSIITIKAGLSHLTPHLTYLVKHSLDFTFNGTTLSSARSNAGHYEYFLNNNQTECCCGCGQIASSNNISSFRISMTTLRQVVTPALLAESTPNPGQPMGKYISFTDSRQKTAISAKHFNIGQEKEYAMGKILHFLSNERLNHNIISEYPLWALSPHVVNNDIYEHLCRDRNDNIERESYRAAVMRAVIGRRLIRGAGSLESMGLVSLVYPTLQAIAMPPRLQIWNTTHNNVIRDEDWRDFLKICLDYHLRMGNCIQPVEGPATILPYEKNYIRDNKPTVISDGCLSFGKKWPTINGSQGNVDETQEKIVLLLCAGLGIKTTTALGNQANYQLVSGLLEDAWGQLTDPNLNLLKVDPGKSTGNNYGYYLDLSSNGQYNSSAARIKLNEEIELCPVTHSLLDVTFMGFSPMIKGKLIPENIDAYLCPGARIRLPLMPTTNKNDIANWMANDPEVAHLKAMGLWSNYYESVFLCPDAYVAAEHSAQLGRLLLEEYTGQFKGDPQFPGRLNILNCSTTMEMGVDIGDIDLVVLSNVPPAASNYLQRAGRAGRFGQSQSAAFTTCSASAIGMEAFFNPDIMLVDKTDRKMPLGSPTIIQRHINSFFFRTFVTSGGMAIDGATTAEDFFIPGAGNPNQSLCDVFINHLNNLPQQTEAEFGELFPATYIYVSSRLKTIVTIAQIEHQFIGTYNALVAQTTAPNITQARQKATMAQLIRFADQDLLSYLSEMQFFPNASMPTGIVEFDASTKGSRQRMDNLRIEIKNLKGQRRNATTAAQKARIDSTIAQKRRELEKEMEQTSVTREANVALSEYAPQQTVVVDEKNFTSFALAERSQYGEESKQKFIQRCENCGWTTFSDLCPAGVSPCPNCANGQMGPLLSAYDDPLATTLPFTFAQAAVGYRADYNLAEDHQEKNLRRFYKINALLPQFTWAFAARVGICDVEGVPEGTIVYTNKGDGYGFAICKNHINGHYCGRAVVDVPLNRIPTEISSGHCQTRWRAVNGIQTAANITRHVVLSCEQQTSYAAFKFFKDYHRNAVLSSQSFLYSMGLVLKKALCRYLAIDEGEIAFDVNRVDTDNFLFLYDTNRGGAGYSSQLDNPQVCQAVFDVALDLVEGFTCDCKDNPGHACTKCLVDRSSYSYSDILSLAEVYDWLKEQKKQFRTVPATISAISPGCRYDVRKAKEILYDAINSNDAHSITFFIPKESALVVDDWCDATKEIGNLLRQAQANGKRIHLVVEKDTTQTDALDTFALFNTVNKLGWFDSVSGAQFGGQVRSVLLVEGTTGIEHYFTTDFDKFPLSNQWGTGCDDLFSDGLQPKFTAATLPDAADVQALLANGRNTLLDGLIPDGAYSTATIFRSIILPYVIKGDQAVIQSLSSVLNGKRVAVKYCEKYLVNPLGCHMLVGLIKEIRDRYNLDIDSVTLSLDDSQCDNPRQNDYTPIRYSFKDNADRDDYISDLIDGEFNLRPCIRVNGSDHHRWLRFVTAAGDVVEIRPDHGISGGWYSSLKYQDLPCPGGAPIPFRKNRTPGKPEESILFYLSIKKA